MRLLDTVWADPSPTAPPVHGHGDGQPWWLVPLLLLVIAVIILANPVFHRRNRR